jgi:isocitrate/isopropylmalate dehydrogenase
LRKYRIAAIQGGGIGASKRTKKQVTSVTKSNGITITMPFWDERFKRSAAEYPLISKRHAEHHAIVD